MLECQLDDAGALDVPVSIHLDVEFRLENRVRYLFRVSLTSLVWVGEEVHRHQAVFFAADELQELISLERAGPLVGQVLHPIEKPTQELKRTNNFFFLFITL
jgi:hypothetical protein